MFTLILFHSFIQAVPNSIPYSVKSKGAKFGLSPLT